MLSSAESHNYHLIINMLLGNNTFDWLMCPLHVNVKSALQSAMPWYLTNLSSMETGDWVLEGRSRGSSPSQGEQLRYSRGTELLLLVLAMKVLSTVLFPMCSLLNPPEPSWLDGPDRGMGLRKRWKIVPHICVLICSCLQFSSVGPCWAWIQRSPPQK